MRLSDARDHLADVVNQATYGKEPIYLTRRGKRVVAIVDSAYLDQLIQGAEDAVDAADADRARQEMAGGAVAIPWEQVKADLGLSDLPR